MRLFCCPLESYDALHHPFRSSRHLPEGMVSGMGQSGVLWGGQDSRLVGDSHLACCRGHSYCAASVALHGDWCEVCWG